MPVPDQGANEYAVIGDAFKLGGTTPWMYIKDIANNTMMYLEDQGTTGTLVCAGGIGGTPIGVAPAGGGGGASTGAFTNVTTTSVSHTELEVTAFTGASTDTLDATNRSLVVLDLAAADTLVTISGGRSGQILRLMNIDAANDPTIDDEGGNIQLIGSNTDLTLGDLHDSVTLQFITTDNGTDLWVEVERCTGH